MNLTKNNYMAYLINTNGEIIEISPINGTYFSLEELQKYVGGHIEVINLHNEAVELARKEERDKAKNLIREAYNALNGLTGLDVDKSLINESSLSRRLREYLVEEE